MTVIVELSEEVASAVAEEGLAVSMNLVTATDTVAEWVIEPTFPLTLKVYVP